MGDPNILTPDEVREITNSANSALHHTEKLLDEHKRIDGFEAWTHDLARQILRLAAHDEALRVARDEAERCWQGETDRADLAEARVQVLEQQLDQAQSDADFLLSSRDHWRKIATGIDEERTKLAARVQALQDALTDNVRPVLEFYADPKNWDAEGRIWTPGAFPSEPDEDRGYAASMALRWVNEALAGVGLSEGDPPSPESMEVWAKHEAIADTDVAT